MLHMSVILPVYMTMYRMDHVAHEVILPVYMTM